jgi:hypothetical protein
MNREDRQAETEVTSGTDCAESAASSQEVLARIPRLNAIEGVQEGAEKLLAGQRIDDAMQHSVLICRRRVIWRFE